MASAVAALLALTAWAVLVWVAIGFGRSARGGHGGAWAWLLLASLAAVLCLFGCLSLSLTALRHLGVLAPSRPRRH